MNTATATATSTSTSTSTMNVAPPPTTNMYRRPRVLLGATDTETANTFPFICQEIHKWADVKAIATVEALNFFNIVSLPASVELYSNDQDTEFISNNRQLQQFLLSWPDILVIAPLSGNTLAKIATGLCDCLLTCIVREWDYKKPAYVTPSLTSSMWNNPLTEYHLSVLQNFGMGRIPFPEATGPDIPEMFDPDYVCKMVRQIVEASIQVNLSWQ